MFAKAAAISALVGASMALPQSTGGKIPADAAFNLQIDSTTDSSLQFLGLSAALNNILINYNSQNASCATTNNVYTATFYLKDSGLYLYSTSATPQQLFADRSGMGQGIIQYTTGAQPAPKNAERGPFALDNSNVLTMDGSNFVACPNEDGSSSIWSDVGLDTPGGREGCVDVTIRANQAPAPVSCSYTQYSA
ncbi:cell wall protein PhiA [Xylariaceae sp. FL0016]|nr:cell wall protein PhiA [Xylariaceae sp. FL0016]